MLRRIWPLVLVLALGMSALIGITSAQAHAMLVRSAPDANASLAQPPAQIDLYFSEAVVASLSQINVLDANNQSVGSGNVLADPADPTHLMRAVKPLGDGVYTVVWKVISSTDGHQTNGTFPFAVGNAAGMMMPMAQQGSTGASGSGSLAIGEVVAKGLLYLAVVTLMGVILFTFLVWTPSLKQTKIASGDVPTYQRNTWRLAVGALILLGIVDVIGLLIKAGQASGMPIGWPWQPALRTLLLSTRLGVLDIARLALALILAGLLLPPFNGWNRWIGVSVCMMLILTFSLESHAASGAHPVLPVLADWLHMLAVSVWVGGLFSFLAGMWASRCLESDPRTRLTAYLIPHFTTLAMTSVGVLLLTGVYSAILRVGTLSALLDTAYGRALILKLVLAAPMLGMGGINFLFTTPIMRRAASRAGGSLKTVTRFSYLLTGEAFMGVAVLAWVGVFTTLPPAKIASSPAGFSATTKVDDLTVALKVDPALPGMNTFTATITSKGKAVADAQDVAVEFNAMSGMMPMSKASLASQGNGAYSLSGGYLAMKDNWDIKVVVTRPGKFDAYADFKLDMTRAAASSGPAPWRSGAAIMIGALAFSYAFAWRELDHNQKRWVGLGLVPALILLVLAVFV